VDIETIRFLNGLVTRGIRPDLTFYLDVPVEVGIKRKRKAGEEFDRLDAELIEFHQGVRNGCLGMINERLSSALFL
jgi:dTMP kinase